MPSAHPQPFLMHIEEVFTFKDGRVVAQGRILSGSVLRQDKLRPAPLDPATVLSVSEDPLVSYRNVAVARAPDEVSLAFQSPPAGTLTAGLILISVGATAVDLEFGIQAATSAIGAAATAEKPQRLRERSALHAAIGNRREAARDALEATYAAEAAQAKRDYQPGQWLQLGTSLAEVSGDASDAGWALMGDRPDAKAVYSERLALFKTGLIAAVAYCRACRRAVVLNKDLRCPNSPRHTAPRQVLFVMPEQVEQARQAVQASRK